MEEVHHFHKGFLGLLLSGHIGEADSDLGLFHIYFGVGLSEGHGVAHPVGQVVPHPLYHPAGEQFSNENKGENGQDPGQNNTHQGVGLRWDFRGEIDIRIGAKLLQQPLSVVRPDARFIDLPALCVLPGEEYQLSGALLQGDLGNRSLVDHIQKFVVRDFDHLPAQHGREDQCV